MTSVPRTRPNKTPVFLTLSLAAVIAITNELWVGGATIYAKALIPAREQAHQAILHNQLPPGVPTWSTLGGNGVNIRILTVWTAEVLHRVTAQSLDRCYRLVDTSALFVDVVLLVVLLQQSFDALLVIAGVLYFASVLPLTYQFHFFEPWDKPSLFFWLAGLLLLTIRRLWLLIPILILGVLTKYDIIVLPLVYFLMHASRADWKRPLAVTVALLACTFGTFGALRFWIPGGFEPRPIMPQVENNISQFLELGLRYPPLLAFGLPTILAAVGFAKADRFAQAAVILAVGVVAILFLQTNFREVRAELPVLVLLMPAALVGLQSVVLRPSNVPQTHGSSLPL